VRLAVPLHQFLSRFVFALAASGLAWPGFAASTLNAEVVGPAGEAIEDAAVFLVPVSAPKPARHAPLSAAVAQHDREFVPYLTVVQTGAAVSFPNQDRSGITSTRFPSEEVRDQAVRRRRPRSDHLRALAMLKRNPGATPVVDALTYYVDLVNWLLEGAHVTEVFARGQKGVLKPPATTPTT